MIMINGFIVEIAKNRVMHNISFFLSYPSEVHGGIDEHPFCQNIQNSYNFNCIKMHPVNVDSEIIRFCRYTSGLLQQEQG